MVDVSPSRIGPAFAPERYELVERVAYGGEGEVWRARESIDGQQFHYAVKIIDGGVHAAARLDALQMQAALATHLEHPALVKVREVFLGPAPPESGSPVRLFFVMKWIEGRSLQQALNAGQVDGPELLRILEPIADALDYLHSGRDTHGSVVLHRDVKPDNILIAGDGRVYLVDFGLMRLRATGSTSRIFGTVPFMAPESTVRGEFTPATDRYALGATVYFGLTGDLPVPGTEDQMRERLTDVLGEGNDRVVRGVLAMLSGIPDRRPVTARDWIRALRSDPPVTSRAVRTDRPAPIRRPTGALRTPSHRTRPTPDVTPVGRDRPVTDLLGGPARWTTRQVVAGSLVALVLLVCVLAGWSFLRPGQDGDGGGPGAGSGPNVARSIDRSSTPPPITALEPALLSVADLAKLLNAKPSDINVSGDRDAGKLLMGGLTALSLCAEKSPVGTDAIAQASASYFSAYAVISYLTAASSIAGFYGNHAAEYMANVRTHAQRCGYQEFAAPGVGEEAFGVHHRDDTRSGGVTAMVFARVGQVVIEVAIAVRARPGTYQADESKLAAAMAARIPR